MRFVPDVLSAPKTGRRTWLLVHPKGLVARREGDSLVFPTDEEAAKLGVDVVAAHRLGLLDDTDAMAAPVDGWIDPPFELFGLRMLAGFLEPALFADIGESLEETLVREVKEEDARA